MSLPDDFDGYLWHDNAIHGLRIVEGADGCSGELVLDIDFIVEWLPPQGEDKVFRFRIAPADLVFHEVTDLVVSIDYASSTAALTPMAIHEIQRQFVTHPTGYSFFAWKIEINWPRNGFIAFRSSGYTQLLRAEPVIANTQYLSPSERTR